MISDQRPAPEVWNSNKEDNFEFKLAIFHDLFERSRVLAYMRSQAYPTMLRGLALDHYYENIESNKKTNFEIKCLATSQYFEGPEYKRKILTKWNGISLNSIKDLNVDKTARGCLQILTKELRHLQHGLDHDLRTDKSLHNKLINACQKVPACQLACFKPNSEGITKQIDNLILDVESLSDVKDITENFLTSLGPIVTVMRGPVTKTAQHIITKSLGRQSRNLHLHAVPV
ncbi:hypothetical protein EV44_g3695 [Erysiphe necator]|uniref:Uncharacterized protein n=1 Tax=Uncinula necator TaxID=52586 RepID=A0A0B1PGB9_UNCNE|nr:hypothetical protein EV44_g3695 [Erysiphe necator]